MSIDKITIPEKNVQHKRSYIDGATKTFLSVTNQLGPLLSENHAIVMAKKLADDLFHSGLHDKDEAKVYGEFLIAAIINLGILRSREGREL